MFSNQSSEFLFNSGFNYSTFIGGWPNVGSYHYSLDGKIDEFRLYNRVLNNDEILDLYYKCKPLESSIDISSSCNGDSAIIELQNTQGSINYFLYDSTNQVNIGPVQYGGCNNILFSTGIVTNYTQFYIKAENPNNGCLIILDTVVNLIPSFSSSTHFDTILACDGDSININGKYYITPNIVSDTFSTTNNCDSILITSLKSAPIPYVNIGNDTVLCNGDSILLEINSSFNSVLWSNGTNHNSIYANSNGIFWIEVSNSYNCKFRDSINIDNQLSTYISIEDTNICDNKRYIINLPNSNTYKWSTGNSSPNISIQEPGFYSVEITDLCKTYTVDFSVKTKDCSCSIFIPNVFTPNNDGLNDFFFPVVQCDISRYHIYIYNRWGELVYESSDIRFKWDGTINNKDATDGVYFYLINYHDNKNFSNSHAGSITLLR